MLLYRLPDGRSWKRLLKGPSLFWYVRSHVFEPLGPAHQHFGPAPLMSSRRNARTLLRVNAEVEKRFPSRFRVPPRAQTDRLITRTGSSPAL
ncbi:hypothetical protein QQF64_032642 [Cirrhinus molitorella]|uniref:Uncharacterized protein n=1 Tax=Cirrhinus molitorella TaxID=172907 RepID=A0ABR3MRM5_9TELE